MAVYGAATDLLNDRRLAISAQLAASLALHVALVLLLFHPAGASVDKPPERSIKVDIVSAAQYAAALAASQLPAPVLRPQAAPQIQPLVPAKPVPPPEADHGSGMVHPANLVAADVLAQPGSRQIREALPLLAGDERMTQLCEIEGLEQLRIWNPKLDPEVIVAYAMGETQVNGLSMRADGAAFRNGHEWRQLKFDCSVAGDFQSVTDFAFSVGDVIPQSEWEAHDLTAAEIE